MRRHKKDNPVELSNMDGKFQTDRASRFFRKGYNCAQSVFAAHAEKLGLDLDTALKISAPLGGGVGRMREICGAFSACAMLAGLKFASAEASKEEKARIYEITQKLAEKRRTHRALLCVASLRKNRGKRLKIGLKRDFRGIGHCVFRFRGALSIFARIIGFFDGESVFWLPFSFFPFIIDINLNKGH